MAYYAGWVSQPPEQSSVTSLEETREARRLSPWQRVLKTLRSHPVTFGILFVGAVVGAFLGVWIPLGPEGWSPVARALSGAIGGLFIALFPLGFRLYGEG